MKTRAASEFVILGALRGRPKHGYDILQFLGDSLGSTWYVSSSQLYTLLKRLERKGLVLSTVETQETRPSKRVFRITEKGRKAFDEWVASATEHVRDMRVEFLAKMFFVRNLSLACGNQLIEKQVQVLKGARERIESLQENESDQYQKLVFSFKLATIEAWLEWLVTQGKNYFERSQKVIAP